MTPAEKACRNARDALEELDLGLVQLALTAAGLPEDMGPGSEVVDAHGRSALRAIVNARCSIQAVLACLEYDAGGA